jgi:hypothetical protein
MARAKATPKPELSPFEISQRHAEADLMAVAELFVNAAEAVAKGDMGRMDTVFEKMPTWHQMLIIRHSNRMDELRAQDDAQRSISAGERTDG